MAADEIPGVSELRKQLEDSKEVTRRTRELLTDPEGLKLQQDLQATAEKALAQGRPDLAATAMWHVRNIQEKETELRTADGVSADAERNARLVLDEHGGTSAS